ncbi:MAG: lactate racemase domain-containing protein [Bacillota bacterium]
MDESLVCIKQKIPVPILASVDDSIRDAIKKAGISFEDIVGCKVGITAGSRGISSYLEVLRTLVVMIKEAGGFPIIIPAMGSHGGGTSAGQIEVLAGLGITEESLGASICRDNETILLSETAQGIPVYCNAQAAKVDKLVVVNRIKPHTDFTGEIESGICKMLAIGLGSSRGAVTVHSHALVNGYEQVITDVAGVMINTLPIFFAVAIAENWKGQTKKIEILLPDEIILKEKGLLSEIKSEMIKLPFKSVDVLVIGEIGKDISGTGMDTKVVGRIMVRGQMEPDFPKIKRIVVLNLSSKSHGNAIGIGLADITTEKVFKAINIRETSLNAISSMSPEQGRLPCIVANDREAIESALLTLGAVKKEGARIVYIKNTLNLETLAVSESMLEEVRLNPYLEVIGRPSPITFNEEGELIDPFISQGD